MSDFIHANKVVNGVVVDGAVGCGVVAMKKNT